MELTITGEVIHWRGPAPYYYVRLPPPQADELHAVSARLTYGWGCIPVSATLGSVRWETSLFPKDDSYLIPLKAAVRREAGVDLGDEVTVTLGLTLR